MKKSDSKYIIYVLQSLKDSKLYIGCTSNLKQRLQYHDAGNVKSTAYRRPLKLIYYENYKDKYEAFNKERYYKTAKGKKEINGKILNHSGIV